MADGYARVTGKVGVCEGPSGGGATYILPGLVEANESSIPILAINTDVSVSSRGTLHADRARPARADAAAHQVERGARPLGRHPARLPRGLRGDDHRPARRGAHRAAVRRAERAGRARRGVGRSDAGRVSLAAGRRRIASIVELAAKLLREARRARSSSAAAAWCSPAPRPSSLALAEKLGAPVATTISGKGSIDERSAHAVGVVGSNGGTPETRAVVDAADLVVFVGCRAGSVTTERWRHPAPGHGAHHPHRRRSGGARHQLPGRRAAHRRCAGSASRRSNEALRGVSARGRSHGRRAAKAREVREVRGARALRRNADQARARGRRA